MKKSVWCGIVSLLLLMAVCLLSCKEKIRNRRDLIVYVNDPVNGLKKIEQIGKIKAAFTYKPWQLMGIKSQTVSNKSEKPYPFKFKDKLFFVLSLSANDKELLRQLQFSQYGEMVQVLAFRMNEFIEAVPDDKKPVRPLECTFQQTYGMGTANNLLIVFNKEKLMAASDLKIRVKEFGLNTGDLNFAIKTKDIKDIQNIALN
jgi:hypothetical protein